MGVDDVAVVDDVVGVVDGDVVVVVVVVVGVVCCSLFFVCVFQPPILYIRLAETALSFVLKKRRFFSKTTI